MHRHPLVHVVLIVGLHAVEHLDFLPSARGVVGIGEGLHHTVVGDGNGGVAPLDGPLDNGLAIAQGVHHGHLGVEVELNALLLGGVLAPLGHGHLVDAVGLQHHVVFEAAHIQPPLDLDPLALFDALDDGVGHLSLQELIDPDGAGVVGDIKADHPRLALGQFPVLYVEHGALHQYAAHIQLQLSQGHRLFPAVDLAVELLDLGLAVAAAGHTLIEHLAAHGLQLGVQVPTRGGLRCRWGCLHCHRGRLSLCLGGMELHRRLVQVEGPGQALLDLIHQVGGQLLPLQLHRHGAGLAIHLHPGGVGCKRSQYPFGEGVLTAKEVNTPSGKGY